MVHPISEMCPQTFRVCGVLVVAGPDEIDLSNAGLLGDALSEVAEEPTVVVSLQGTRYISASGLTVLVREHNRRQALGARLLVVLPSTPADRIFQVTALDRHLLCYRDQTDAIVAARWRLYDAPTVEPEAA